jgi:purine-binding chemotaxis protein CheW
MPANSAHAALDAAFEASEEKSISFLLFSLGKELYGAPLLATREVIRQGDIKPAPYMVPHFRGVINLRGQIVSVIDLRIKFGIATTAQMEDLILIVESPHGLLGVVVDDVLSVEKVQKEEIDREVQLETKVPLDFFLGVAKIKGRLVNMVDIAGCLSSDELRSIQQAS